MRLGWIWSLLPRPSAQRPKTCRTTPQNHIQNITLFRRTTAPQQFQHLTRRKAALYLSREVIDGRGEREESRGRRKETADLICEVLHRVLYPNTHENGLEKKKNHELPDMKLAAADSVLALFLRTTRRVLSRRRHKIG